MKLLDTDICIHLLNAREPQLIEHFRAHSPTKPRWSPEISGNSGGSET